MSSHSRSLSAVASRCFDVQGASEAVLRSVQLKAALLGRSIQSRDREEATSRIDMSLESVGETRGSSDTICTRSAWFKADGSKRDNRLIAR